MGQQEAPRESTEQRRMRAGIGTFKNPTEERLSFIQQLGVEDVQINMFKTSSAAYDDVPLTGEHKWSYEELADLKATIEDAGLRLNAIEGMPIPFYDDIMLGGENRDEQLEHFKNTVRNMGRAGIPIMGLLWMPAGVWRTEGHATARGGAEVTGFDLDLLKDPDALAFDREYSETEMWDNFERFLQEVMPVAEEAGVKIGIHPSDPPVDKKLGGVPALFRNFENFKRAMELYPSDNLGLVFCLGNWSARHGGGEKLLDKIRYFGERDKIFYVHFQSVEGTVPSFKEGFINEGNYDSVAVIRTLHDVGFDGMIIPGHTPLMARDTEWLFRDRREDFEQRAGGAGGFTGRAYWTGYLQGMLDFLYGAYPT